MKGSTFGLAAALAVVSLSAHATPVAFSFDYLDGANEGFNDATTGASARAALEFAGSVWGSYLPASYAGETIHVAVKLDPFAAADASYLAFGGSNFFRWNNTNKEMANTIYSDALANHLAGRDLSASDDEAWVTFNSDKLFYLGTDFNALSPSYDFVSLALHEMGHGLGFLSRIDKDNSDGSIGGMRTTTSFTGVTNQYASIYDTFLVNENGVRLVDMTDAQRAAAITSSNVFWSGANAKAANGNVQPEIFAPETVSNSSSLVHFDDVTHFLMDPNLSKGEDVQVDAVTLGALKDMGWAITPVPEPSSYAMLLIGLLGLGAWKRSRSSVCRCTKKPDVRIRFFCACRQGQNGKLTPGQAALIVRRKSD